MLVIIIICFDQFIERIAVPNLNELPTKRKPLAVEKRIAQLLKYVCIVICARIVFIRMIK